MDVIDINRLESQSDINTQYNATNQAIEDHLVILDELKQILEFECSKDPMADSANRPDVEAVKRIKDIIKDSSRRLATIYST